MVEAVTIYILLGMVWLALAVVQRGALVKSLAAYRTMPQPAAIICLTFGCSMWTVFWLPTMLASIFTKREAA